MKVFFNALTSIIAEFPISKFIFVISSPCKEKGRTIYLFFYSPVYLVIAHRSFNRRKKYVLIIGI